MPARTQPRNDEVERAIVEGASLLEANLHNLPLRDRAFATSLLAQLEDRGLTDKQLYWLAKMMQKSVTRQE
jgi:hypothetical protein